MMIFFLTFKITFVLFLWASSCLAPLLSNAIESLHVGEISGIHLFCVV